MAETLPLNIPIPASAAIASFNYTDIAEGTGVVKFYGATSHSDGTKYYYLTTNTPYSQDIVISGAQVLTDGTQLRIVQNTYGIRFNRPQNAKGTAYLNITIGGYSVSLFSGNKLWISGAYIQASGATTTTNMSPTVSGAVYNFTAANTVESQSMLIPLPITGTQHFKAGEWLRLYIDLWGYNEAGDLSHGGYGNDPADRNDTTAKTIADASTTKLELYVPMLLNTN